MRLRRLALAGVVLLGWAGASTASPLIPMQARVSLKPQNIVEAARWRHRHRDYFRSERSDDTGGPARSFTDENRSATAEVVPSDLGRRYHRGRFWGGRRDANRDETGGVALSLNRGANRFTPSEVVRSNPRRRGGWVDPPPAQ
jgi:hypothetical protein